MKPPAALSYRCSYLFFALLLLLAVVPLFGSSAGGRIAANLVNLAILVAAVVAVGRGRIAIGVAIALAIPLAGFQIAAILTGDTLFLMLSWVFVACFYFATLSLLLRYVFLPQVINADKLYGAAAAYLMIGVIWAYFYSIIQYFVPGAFGPPGPPLTLLDLLYFSFAALTTAGFGDIVALHPMARSLTMLEQILGVLYVAILIARLSGMYPGEEEHKK